MEAILSTLAGDPVLMDGEKPAGVSVAPAEVVASVPDRLARAKSSFTTRRVPYDAMQTVVIDHAPPRRGDLVLAKVREIGHHTKLQLATGRPSRLFLGDEIILCAGNRYAPDQFEAVVPQELGPCHLAAAGGIAGQVLSQHDKIMQPTAIETVGFVGDAQGRRLNVGNFALPEQSCARRVLTIAVTGTAMNSGKTTVAAHIIRGLATAGHAVGAAKVTGTGAYGDYWAFHDAGARWVVDFTDAGFASTYLLDPEEVAGVHSTLVAALAQRGASVIVLEVADGEYQRETAALIASPTFRASVDGVVFAALDAPGAVNGVHWLTGGGLPVLAVSGLVTRSGLAAAETRRATNLPVVPTQELAQPQAILDLLPQNREQLPA